MTNLSRRKVLAGAIATPVVVEVSASAMAAISRPAAMSDELLERAAEWIAADQRLRTMEIEWQELESRLFNKAALLKIDCLAAERSGLPEARALRALDRRIKATYRKLERSAGEAGRIPATTIAGALAKIELGLKVQGPFDWRDHALELLQDGVLELRALNGHG